MNRVKKNTNSVDFGSIEVMSDNEETEEERNGAMGYQQTLMYGRYSKSLGEEVKKRQKIVEKLRVREMKRRRFDSELKMKNSFVLKICNTFLFCWRHTFAKLGEDWVFLGLLGLLMALVSFAMDYTISLCNNARLWLVEDLISNIYLQFLAWVILPVALILFSTGFVNVVAPQAIGSGIPEMKVILRGVVLKEYLTFKTFVAKVVGLTATLGSGMPLGKEGPFVHIASIVAALMSRLVTSFQGIYANESRKSEMLAAACAVGVACCFGAPIGGVLFSIEVTSVYFAVRNYWRGFFAAVIGAIVFRLLSVWFEREETIVAVFRTTFPNVFPYDPQELFVFALIGVICGVGGALFVFIHRKYVLWMRSNKQLNKFLQQNRFIYPFAVSFFISALTFPGLLGKFLASDTTTHEQVLTLFSNFTWARAPNEMEAEEYEYIKHWRDPYSDSIFVSLTIYIIATFFLSILASTLPVPSGVLIPTFKIGAAFGRLVGEAMHVWFPEGVRYGDQISYILPGGYATVGAAAFSGAVTHTISISVIVFELTGQITHAVPVLVAVLISNAIASFLQPSCYDSIILIKKLPYLPDIIPSSSGAYNIFVESFMLSDVKYIWYGMSYAELRDVLRQGKKLKGFPLVDNPEHMVLLGSIRRQELIAAIEKQIGRDRRLAEQSVRRQEASARRVRQNLQDQEGRLKEIARELDQARLEQETARRPSRFAVSMVSDQGKEEKEESSSSRQIKGILKSSPSDASTNATVHGAPQSSPYSGLAGGAADKWRYTVQNITSLFSAADYSLSPPSNKKRIEDFDMSPEEQRDWEQEELARPVIFAQLKIDPAPFQLPEKSSLLKVHSLFSMLGVNHAYVTTIGRLIGVVGLKELRKAIEDVNHRHGPGQEHQQSAADCTEESLTGLAQVKTENYDHSATITSLESSVPSSLLSNESNDNIL